MAKSTKKPAKKAVVKKPAKKAVVKKPAKKAVRNNPPVSPENTENVVSEEKIINDDKTTPTRDLAIGIYLECLTNRGVAYNPDTIRSAADLKGSYIASAIDGIMIALNK